MRRLPIVLAAAALIPGAGFAQQATDAQKDEVKCVYTALTLDQREQVLTALYGDDTKAEAARKAVQPPVVAAEDGCATRYGWTDAGRSAGQEYAAALIGYEAISDAVPEELAKKLDALMAAFPAAYADTFSQQGHEAVTDDDAWEKEAYQRLDAAGIAETDRGAAVIYLAALADLNVAGGHWGALLANDKR